MARRKTQDLLELLTPEQLAEAGVKVTNSKPLQFGIFTEEETTLSVLNQIVNNVSGWWKFPNCIGGSPLSPNVDYREKYLPSTHPKVKASSKPLFSTGGKGVDTFKLHDKTYGEIERVARPIILELARCGVWDKKMWVGYHRKGNRYPPCNRYNSFHPKKDQVLRVVGCLHAMGYLEHETGKFFFEYDCGYSSRIRATKKLRTAFEGCNLYNVKYLPEPETIILRNSDGELVDYDDNPFTYAARHNCAEINRRLNEARIGLFVSDLKLNKDLKSRSLVLAGNRNTVRIFNEDFRKRIPNL